MTRLTATQGNGGQATPQIGDYVSLNNFYSSIPFFQIQKGANHPEGVMTKSPARLAPWRGISWGRTDAAVTAGRFWKLSFKNANLL